MEREEGQSLIIIRDCMRDSSHLLVCERETSLHLDVLSILDKLEGVNSRVDASLGGKHAGMALIDLALGLELEEIGEVCSNLSLGGADLVADSGKEHTSRSIEGCDLLGIQSLEGIVPGVEGIANILKILVHNNLGHTR